MVVVLSQETYHLILQLAARNFNVAVLIPQ